MLCSLWAGDGSYETGMFGDKLISSASIPSANNEDDSSVPTRIMGRIEKQKVQYVEETKNATGSRLFPFWIHPHPT